MITILEVVAGLCLFNLLRGISLVVVAIGKSKFGKTVGEIDTSKPRGSF